MSEEKNKIKAIQKDLTPDEMAEAIAHMDNPDNETVSRYVCEVCGKEEDLTEADAFQQGWDYPPFIGMWGVLSPRTCGDCLIDKTAYWHVLTQGSQDIPEHHMKTIRRVLAERLPTADG